MRLFPFPTLLEGAFSPSCENNRFDEGSEEFFLVGAGAAFFFYGPDDSPFFTDHERPIFFSEMSAAWPPRLPRGNPATLTPFPPPAKRNSSSRKYRGISLSFFLFLCSGQVRLPLSCSKEGTELSAQFLVMALLSLLLFEKNNFRPFLFRLRRPFRFERIPFLSTREMNFLLWETIRDFVFLFLLPTDLFFIYGPMRPAREDVSFFFLQQIREPYTVRSLPLPKETDHFLFLSPFWRWAFLGFYRFFSD